MSEITREEFNRLAAAVELLAIALRRNAYITTREYEDVLSMTSGKDSEDESPR